MNSKGLRAMAVITMELADDLAHTAVEFDLLKPEVIEALIRQELQRKIEMGELPEGIQSSKQVDGSYQLFARHPHTSELVEIAIEQVWFWTKGWQQREQQANADLQAERYEDFDDIESFVASL
jgi:hypothetical protein